MESSSADVTASAGSAESEDSLTISSSRSEVVGSEWMPDEASTSAKPKKSNCVLPEGTFIRSATLTPSQSDPDINAIYHTVISKVDGLRVFKCAKCGNEYTRPYSARRHANVHLKDSNVNCGICKIRLTGPLSLALHMKEKHKKPKPPPLQIIKKITKSSSSTAASRTRSCSVMDKIAIDSPASKTNSNLDINSNLKSKIIDCMATKDASEAVIEPTNEPKAEPIDLPHERRSTRIQMRMAIEASAMEEEERSARPRKVTPPPIYPSNLEKMKEIKESKARRALSVHRHVQKPPQPEPEPEMSRQEQEEPEIIVERVVAGTSTNQTSSSPVQSAARASSSREGLIAKPGAARAAGGTRMQKPVYPIAAAAGRRASQPLISPLPPFATFLMPPSPAMTPTTTCASMGSGSPANFVSPYNNGSSSSPYPRPGSLYGPPVHQHQTVFTAPAHTLYPAPLSSTLLHTIYNPAWLRPTVMGEDEKRAKAQYGHTDLMLPARMNQMSTMISKCLNALKETSMPLPPLQPLLPVPCRLLQHESCDPLTDVLESVPRISANPFFSSHRVNTAVQPRYTIANEGVRYHMMMTKQMAVENEDWNKKWWEVRTFPSFAGLTTSCSRTPPPTSARSDDGTVTPDGGGVGTYTMAGHWTRRHAMKCTYVTSKKPMFSVAESQSVPRLTPGYSTPGSSTLTTPRSATPSVIAVSCTAEPRTTQRRRPAAPRRPGAAARAAMAAAPQKKRPAAETGPGEVDALVKRIKTSFSETFPGRTADRPMSQELQQKSAQLMQQAMQAVQGYCITEAPSNSTVIPTQPARQEEITIDQDGTTFTVL